MQERDGREDAVASSGHFLQFVRLVLISAVFGGVVGVGVAPALAVTANSQNKNFTVGGKGDVFLTLR
jgi:hypothetical protein